jgi:hypothetical protein
MNVQPPVHDRLIVLPNATQRDVVDTGRKPSLVPSGQPHPVRSHTVAVRAFYSFESHLTRKTANTSQGIGEFLGTFLFLFFAFAGAQVANEAESATNPDGTTTSPALGTLMYISLAFGFSLAVNAWVFFRISGGLFNPAVALGLALIGCITYTRLAVVFNAQIIGAIASAGVVAALFPDV